MKIEGFAGIDEKYGSITYVCIKFTYSYSYTNESLDTLVSTLMDEDFLIPREVFGDRWQFVKQKIVHPYEAFKKISDYNKPLTNPKKEDLISCITTENPDLETTIKIIKEYNLKTEQQLQEFFRLKDLFLSADVFHKNVEDSRKIYGLFLLHFISLSGYANACALHKNQQQINSLKGQDLYLPVEIIIRGGVSGLFGHLAHYILKER